MMYGGNIDHRIRVMAAYMTASICTDRDLVIDYILKLTPREKRKLFNKALLAIRIWKGLRS